MLLNLSDVSNGFQNSLLVNIEFNMCVK